MASRLKIALGCYLLAAIALGAWGVMYLARSEFLPYHSAAVGMSWSAVPAPFQVLLLGLIKLAGGVFLTLAAALLVILLIPFRRGEKWALVAMPALGVTCCLALANAMAFVGSRSSASPPWAITLAALILVLAGAALSLSSRTGRNGV